MARFDIMTVTAAAAGRVAEILERSPQAAGIRLGVKNGGCAGMEYTVEIATETKPGEDRIETPGGAVFVTPAAVLFLLGTELDYEVTQLRSGFVFNNPNQKSACGCGESVELAPAQMSPEMLQSRSGPAV